MKFLPVLALILLPVMAGAHQGPYLRAQDTGAVQIALSQPALPAAIRICALDAVQSQDRPVLVTALALQDGSITACMGG